MLRSDCTTAFMTGKLKMNGNIGLALKLENMLK
ncbi:SCP2 sterol-binding domain-containing protein [Virgibacillus byunsanensis]|uniref:SCP2 sterol-binding domain-containing protein n=1 Tax=Virgibacillus byunsanensis TaxID=570945 RepID=A0ABW3LQX6_9BACI